jgi:dipeptidyl aminopeptidase/acylaminoacyl peptidase
MRALMEKRYDGRDLRRGRLITDAGPYKRYRASFRGDGLTITGIMNVPDGRGPFPVVVLNHGYIDPDVYVSGQGMAREQDYLARRGYVVLHVDYRNHAGSGRDPDADYQLRLPYVVDTINAVKAVKSSRLPFLDRDKVAWMGRSMGGGITLAALVAQPGLVDAAVLYASTSSLAADNWRQFYRRSPDRSRINRRIARGYGLPQDNPGFWRRASPRPYFERITEPVLIFHGGRDDSCPISWARATHRSLRQAGVDSRLVVYANEGHRFEGEFFRSIRRSVRFLDAQLR